MTATASPVPAPAKPRHAKPSPATPEPAKTHHAKPRHAKPKHHATRAPEAGDDGPFRDAEGDGKIMDDLFGTVIPDGVLPMGGNGGKPVDVSGSDDPVRGDGGRRGHHHRHHHWR
jgi:hypothetical protein